MSSSYLVLVTTYVVSTYTITLILQYNWTTLYRTPVLLYFIVKTTLSITAIHIRFNFQQMKFENKLHDTQLCRDVVMSWCRDVVMSWCRDVVLSWCRDAVMPWCRDAVMPWCRDAVISWYRDIVISWCHDAIGPSGHHHVLTLKGSADEDSTYEDLLFGERARFIWNEYSLWVWWRAESQIAEMCLLTKLFALLKHQQLLRAKNAAAVGEKWEGFHRFLALLW
jgi:hypothetical protein